MLVKVTERIERVEKTVDIRLGKDSVLITKQTETQTSQFQPDFHLCFS